jgi:dienelactone hydrolase
MRRWLFPIIALLSGAAFGRAEVIARPVEYKHAGDALEGFVILDSAVSGKRPGVLLVHEAGAANTAARAKAAPLARAGYVVLTADLYGKGVLPKDSKDAAMKAGLNGKDRTLVRERLQAALGLLARQPQVDPKRLGAIGYGVGGTAVLELARAGAELEGVVCVHGELGRPQPDEAKKIGASILVLVGSDDPFIPLTQIGAFEDEMRKGGVDWQIVRYGGAAHDFTNPAVGRNLKSGSAYDADADRRAGEAIRAFLADAFAPTAPAPAKAPPKETPTKTEAKVPEKVLKVLKHVDERGEALDGYEGGRTFLNVEKHLPQTDDAGKRIKYREWDVNPLRQGTNRGPERLVTGSDGSAYYTDDHYRTFTKIR